MKTFLSIITIACVLLVPVVILAQTTTISKIQGSSTEKISQSTSEYQKSDINQKYLDILEKTNQQLSLWYNPMNLFVSALGVLFAIGAIVAGVLIYRQSQDYRELIDEDRKNYSEKISQLIKSENEILESQRLANQEANKKLENLVKEYEKKLSVSGKKQQKEIEKAINEIKREQANITNRVGFNTTAGTAVYGGNLGDYSSTGIGIALNGSSGSVIFPQKVCPHCGARFLAPVASLLNGNTRKQFCPSCGEKL